MVTFADMMTLLMCFFVLLLSFSTMEMAKFKTVAGFMREAFGVQREHNYTAIPSGQLIVAAGSAESSYEKISLMEKVKVVLEKMELEAKVEAKIDPEGVRLRIEGEALFGSGAVALQEEMAPFLEEVARLAREHQGTVVVEGHSDDRPIRTARYPSNWELSSARAGAVVRWLTEQGGVPAHRIRALGLADTRPVDTNETVEGRARNRRVEILFEVDETVDESPAIEAVQGS
jgi:chemotaxis protein MotB